MKYLSWAGIVVSALVLSACDLAPAYSPPKVDLPPKFKEDAVWRVAHPSDNLPRGAWWTAFKDPTLNALEPQIEEANQNLANALANYLQARTNVEQAQAGCAAE